MPPETVGGADRAGRGAVADRARSRNHAGGQPELGRGRALRRRSPPPGSTGCRSASRRSTRRRCGFSAGGTTATRRSRRSAWRATPSRAISFDLIYARPGQTLAAWEAELDEALTLAGEHLSLYQLTIEPGTAFGNRAARGETLAADEETAAALFEATQRRLDSGRAAGLRDLEPRPARRRMPAQPRLLALRDYLGIGPGAHGRVTSGGGKVATPQTARSRGVARRDRGRGHGDRGENADRARHRRRGNGDDGAAARRGRLAAPARSARRARCRDAVRAESWPG